MKISQFILLNLLLGTALPHVQAQEAATNAMSALAKPASATKPDVYHLDTSFGYRWPLNGDCRWLMPATIVFGKMLDDHNTLDAAFSGGVIELKPGSTADAQAHQPSFWNWVLRGNITLPRGTRPGNPTSPPARASSG
jgi:hypothetical protein